MEGVSGFFTSWHSPELQIRCYSTRKGGGNTQFLARFSFDSSTLLSRSPESQGAQSSKRSGRCESSGYKCLTTRNSWKESEANEIVAPPARPAKFPAKYTRYPHCVQEYAQAGAGSRGIGRQVRAQIQRKTETSEITSMPSASHSRSALESALNKFPRAGAGRTYLRDQRSQRGQLCGAFPDGGSADGSPFSPVDRHVFRSMLMLVFVV